MVIELCVFLKKIIPVSRTHAVPSLNFEITYDSRINCTPPGADLGEGPDGPQPSLLVEYL